MINQTIINLNNETDFKFSYCYSAIYDYCVLNGYNTITQNQNNIMILIVIIIFILIWFLPNYRRGKNES